MHILHVCSYYAPAWGYGGVVSAVSGLAEAQVKRGHQVTVLTTDTLNPYERVPNLREMINGVEVIRCRNLSNSMRGKLNLSSPLEMYNQFRRLSPDIVHVHELRTVENLLIDHRAPIVLSPHGTISYGAGRSTIKLWWDRLFGRGLLRKIDHVAALTINEENEARKLWNLLNIPFPDSTIIPNGVNEQFFNADQVKIDLRQKYGLGSGEVILFMGRLHERKGLQFLIPAFAKIAPNFPDARLLIVGPDEGMLQNAKNLVAELGISDRVVFTGLLTGDHRLAALAAADVFVLPAIGEGLSMASLEALASGLPLILTPGCNLPEVELVDAGIIVEREIEALVQGFQKLLSNHSNLKLMGKNGQKWAREFFTWRAVFQLYEKLYDDVLHPHYF